MEKRAAILFSDIKGFSAISDPHLREKISDFNRDLITRLLTTENSFYHNTWGDAFFICSDDSYHLAEIALRIRDSFKNTNWKKSGFPSDLGVRIGLHLENIIVKNDKKNKIFEVLGKGIDLTARIEPIVDINEVFCSKEFRDDLLSNNYESKIDATSIGIRQLAKNYAEKSLFKIDWRSSEGKYLNNKIEELYWYDRYIFHDENKIEFESYRVIKVVDSKLEKLPILTQWSGRGNFKISSSFFDTFQMETDDKGNVNFDYPIPNGTKFGDTITVHYKYEAEDTTGSNIPIFMINFRRKTEYFHLDIILKHKDYNDPAELEVLYQDHGAFPKEISQIEFDKLIRTYKFDVSKPPLNTKYTLKWKK